MPPTLAAGKRGFVVVDHVHTQATHHASVWVLNCALGNIKYALHVRFVSVVCCFDSPVPTVLAFFIAPLRFAPGLRAVLTAVESYTDYENQ